MATPLQEQCQLKILLNIEDYRPEVLGLLPLKVRRKLLSALPMIHLAALEGTPFMQGINCEEEAWRERYEEVLHLMNDLKLVLPYPRETNSSYRGSCQEMLLFLILHRSWPYSRFPIGKLLFCLRTNSPTAVVPPRYRNVNTVELLRNTIALFRTLPRRLHVECSFFQHTVFWREDWSEVLQMLLANVQHFSYGVLVSESQAIASYLLGLNERSRLLQCISISW